MKLPLVLSISLLLVAICGGAVHSEVPSLINYQGYLTDGGAVVSDGKYDLTFSLYNVDVGGVSIWSETHAAVLVTDGLFSTVLGSINPLSADLFDDPQVFLGITIDSDPELAPRQQILAMAFAFRVATVDGATGGDISSSTSIGSGNSLTGENSLVVGLSNTLNGDGSTIAGGESNEVSSQHSFIGSGVANLVSADNAVVVGGSQNQATDEGAVVGGGQYNSATGLYSVVAGGGSSDGAFGNTASGLNSAVGGGRSNSALDAYATVSGGGTNTAGGIHSFVGGGLRNTASGARATIGGGYLNLASGNYSFIGGGGVVSTVADSNVASGVASVVTGGSRNWATALFSTIPGGYDNHADGMFSFAAGRQAIAAFDGCFVWADSGDTYFESTAANQFIVRAGGGVGINTASPAATLHLAAPAGEGNEILRLQMERSWAFRQFNTGANTSLELASLTAGAKDFIITTEGNVGIGNGFPSEKLHVVGNICATGTIGACSDGRFKTDIHSIDDPLNTVTKLNGVKYHWNTADYPDQEFTDREQVGFVAQELLEIMPEVVSQGRDGYYSVDYGKLTPLLVEAVKQLSAQVEQQDSKIGELKSALAEMRLILQNNNLNIRSEETSTHAEK